MIAADTSSLIAFFHGEAGPDVERLAQAMTKDNVVIPPVVLTELLTRPPKDPNHRHLIGQIPLLSMDDGFWLRAANSRRRMIEKGLKSHLGDALIAQSCIDHDVLLITRDTDFEKYAVHCGPRLAI